MIIMMKMTQWITTVGIQANVPFRYYTVLTVTYKSGENWVPIRSLGRCGTKTSMTEGYCWCCCAGCVRLLPNGIGVKPLQMRGWRKRAAMIGFCCGNLGEKKLRKFLRAKTDLLCTF